jgi:hypothetical protein
MAMTHGRDGRDQDAARVARALFERAAQAMPAATAARLRQQRTAALRGPAPTSSRALAWGLPAGAMAALLVGLAWWRAMPAPATTEPGVPDASPAADVVALPAVAPDEADLYAWLAEAPVASDATSEGAL